MLHYLSRIFVIACVVTDVRKTDKLSYNNAEQVQASSEGFCNRFDYQSKLVPLLMIIVPLFHASEKDSALNFAPALHYS